MLDHQKKSFEFFCHYETMKFSCCPHLSVHKKNGIIKFQRPFQRLWKLLEYTGPLSNLGGGVATDFPSPAVPTSNLLGKSFLSDPSSEVRVVDFENLTVGGPILTSGFALETYNDTIDYLISWSLSDLETLDRCSHSIVKIGFYTSDSFEFNVENQLRLICGRKGASIFAATPKNHYTGSFRCRGVARIYVAVDRPVEVRLKVTRIIPPYIIFPEVNVNHPVYTKYLAYPSKSTCKSNYQSIPVYTIRSLDLTFRNLILKPTRCFRRAAKIIDHFLEATSLSITLFQPVESRLNLQAPIIYRAPQLESYEIVLAGALGTSRAQVIVTNQLGIKGTYDALKVGTVQTTKQGIKTDVPAGYYPRISYQISTYVLGDSMYSDPIFVSVQLHDYDRFWGDLVQFQPAGKAIISYPNQPLFRSDVPNPKIFEGSFLLGPNVPDFNITVYYTPEDDETFLTFATFVEVRIDHVAPI